MKYSTPRDYTPDYIADRLQLLDLCTRYAVGVDRKDWELFRSCFTEDAVIDYTATGGPRHRRDGTVALSDRVVILGLAAGDGTRSQPCLPWSSVSDARHKTVGSAPRPQAVA